MRGQNTEFRAEPPFAPKSPEGDLFFLFNEVIAWKIPNLEEGRLTPLFRAENGRQVFFTGL